MSRQSEPFGAPRLSSCQLLSALLTAAATGLAGHAPALSAQTNERRFLVEFNFSPAFIAVAGNSLTDESVDELVVDSWKPGITIGYLVLDRLAVSYSWLPGLDLTLHESWGFKGAGDVDIELPHRTGDVHGMDVRLVPLGGGFQIGASYLRVQASTYHMDAVRTGSELALGNGSYPTDATAEWVTVADNRLGLGMSYSWTAGSHLTLSGGLMLPIPFGDGDITDATIVPTEASVTFAPEDVQSGIQALDAETFYAPVVLRMGVGWAFGLGGR